MIPDSLKDCKSKGEEYLFGILKRLPENYIVYWEAQFQKGAKPDFIIIAPELGLIFVEVKGWYPSWIRKINHREATIKSPQQDPSVERLPAVQAEDYMFMLKDKLKRIKGREVLLHPSGPKKSKPNFAYTFFAVLSNIEESQAKDKGIAEAFPKDMYMYRDELLRLCNSNLSGNDLVNEIGLKKFFGPFTGKKFDQKMIDVLKGAIHKEIIISDNSEDIKDSTNDQQTKEKEDPTFKQVSENKEYTIKVLDLKQESNVRKIGAGHRVVYGVAGAGKTILLIARAKLLAQENPKEKILVLCYNVCLANYLRKILHEYINIIVTHFDGFSKENNIIRNRQSNETSKSLGERLLNHLESGDAKYSNYFYSILIDEAQDFEPSWFQCSLAAMQDPNDGDLLIVADANQGLYKRTGVSWKSLGINAQGARTMYGRLDLHKNYRNTREIIKCASLFSSAEAEKKKKKKNDVQALKTYLNECKRSNGIQPRLLRTTNIHDECLAVNEIVKDLLSGKWLNKKIDSLQPRDIGILYARCPKNNISSMNIMIDSLNKICPNSVIWLTERGNLKREQIEFDGIHIQTIHSAKGLQFKAVILMWADQLPRNWGENIDESADMRLFYVGLTRPEDYLVITSSGQSPFLDKLEESKLVDIA